MAVTIHTLVYKTIMDSKEFTKGSVATRSELRESKKLWLESRTDAEKYGLSVGALGTLHKKGAIDNEVYNRSLNRLQSEFKETAAAAGRLKVSVSGIGGLLGQLGIGLSVAGTVGLLKGSVEAAEEAARAENKLRAVLNATGNAAGFSAEQLLERAKALEILTTVDGDLITSAMGVMSTFRKVNGEVFTEGMRLALDMSVVMDQDLKSSVVQLGKALNDPIEGINALRRAGVSFTEQQREQIEAFVETGDLLSAQKMILRELQDEFGGAAEKMRSPLDDVKNAVGDLSEEFGKLFTQTEAGKGFWDMMAEGARAAAQELADLRKDDEQGGGKHFFGLSPWSSGKQVRDPRTGEFLDVGPAILNTPQTNPAQMGPGAVPGKPPPEDVDLPEAKSSKSDLAEQERLADRMAADREALEGELSERVRKAIENRLAEDQKALDKLTLPEAEPATEALPPPPPPAPRMRKGLPPTPFWEDPADSMPGATGALGPMGRAAQEGAEQAQRIADDAAAKVAAARKKAGLPAELTDAERIRAENRKRAEGLGINLDDPALKEQAARDLEKIRKLRAPGQQALEDARRAARSVGVDPLANLDPDRAQRDLEKIRAAQDAVNPLEALQKNLENVEAEKAKLAEPIRIPIEVSDDSGTPADKMLEKLRGNIDPIQEELDRLSGAGASEEQLKEAEKLLEKRESDKAEEAEVREGQRLIDQAERERDARRGFVERLQEKDDPNAKFDKDLAKLQEAREFGDVTPEEFDEIEKRMIADRDNAMRKKHSDGGAQVMKRGSAEAFKTIFDAMAGKGASKNPNAKVEENTAKGAEATEKVVDKLNELKEQMAKNLSAGF